MDRLLNYFLTERQFIIIMQFYKQAAPFAGK